jgi:CRP/FNR family cyclic AMP-dependent transcriptional regulator
MAAHTKLWYLERFRLLDALTDAQKRTIEKSTRMLEVKRGQEIYLPGDPSDQVFLLKAGVIKILTGRPGEEGGTILAFLHPGDIFGELAIVDNAPRDHVAVAHEDAVLCALDRSTLQQMMEQSPALGYQITKLIGLQVRRFRTRLERLLYKSAHARVAQALLDLGEEHGLRDGAGILVPLRLSQSDLGHLVGLARETVNIVLQDFKQQGLIESDRRSIRLLDPDRLRHVA